VTGSAGGPDVVRASRGPGACRGSGAACGSGAAWGVGITGSAEAAGGAGLADRAATARRRVVRHAVVLEHAALLLRTEVAVGIHGGRVHDEILGEGHADPFSRAIGRITGDEGLPHPEQ